MILPKFVVEISGFEPLTSRDPVLLADYIEENQINRTFISPKMLKVFKQKGNSLKTVFTGSERVSNIYSDEYDIYVAYGQTESAGAVLAFKIDKPLSALPKYCSLVPLW